MSKNTKQNTKQTALTAKPKTCKKKLTRKTITIVSISSVLVAALIIALIIGFINIINDGKTVDYMNDDLSRYVYIDNEYYEKFPVTSPLYREDKLDVEVQRKINKLLVTHKDKNALYDGAAVHKPSHILAVGDVVNIWFSGYIMEDGVRKTYDGMSNYADPEPNALELGSGVFITGFEEALIGMKLQSFDFEKKSIGTVSAGDVIYLSYQAFNADGTISNRTAERIDLSDPNVDSVYGVGFAKFFEGKTIAERFKDKLTFRIDGEKNDTVYYDVKVEYATRGEENAIKINVVFPPDYQSADLRGKAVTFDVFAYTAVLYNTPEFNDEFVTETLKESAESLADYEGSNLAEKYRDKLMTEAKDSLDQANTTIKEEDFWTHVKDKCVVKKLPKNEVQLKYQEYFNAVKAYFETYQMYYETLDECAMDYFGLSSDVGWRDEVMKMAENDVLERLLFYYIMRDANLVPSEKEISRLYDENVEDALDYYKELYKEEIDKCETEEAREAKIAEIKADMLKYYGEDYFRENALYQHFVKIIVKGAVVK